MSDINYLLNLFDVLSWDKICVKRDLFAMILHYIVHIFLGMLFSLKINISFLYPFLLCHPLLLWSSPFSDLHLVSSRFQLGIVCTRCSRPQSLSVAHPISDPTTLQIQSVATPLVRCSPRVSVPPNRYGFPSSNSGNSISTLTVALSNFDILTCYSHAAKHDCWRQAMQEEIAALKANHTWDIEPCPPTIVPLGRKWVYSIKVRSDGSLDHYKAQLVALGNNKEYGVNYEETFAPMAKMITVCTILALAASSDWPLHQMDVKNAFLHGDLKKCIYMKPPPGLFPFPTSHVCKLHHSLYGLKQAPRAWFDKFRTTLL